MAEALLDDGHELTCLLRASPSGAAVGRELQEAGAHVVFEDLGDLPALKRVFAETKPETVISCIASRSGAPKDAEAIDCNANLNLVKAAETVPSDHLILLSAICVQKPRLAFQRAKKIAESAFQSSNIDWTIIRPTAFFKSLSGQVGRVLADKPFLLFGDGELTRCKPISDRDLARYIADCVTNPARRNQTLPIGGPGPAITSRKQAEILFELTGKAPRYRSISPDMFTWAERALSIGAPVSDWFAAKAEYARIARYYATESMLVLHPETEAYCEEATPEFGSDTLRDHYAQLIADAKRAS